MVQLTQDDEFIRQQFNLQTAQIAWQELQRFFAAGKAVNIAADLDLLHVAVQIVKDNKEQIEKWMSEEKVVNISDELAQKWIADDKVLWAVVVNPWVLVQDK